MGGTTRFSLDLSAKKIIGDNTVATVIKNTSFACLMLCMSVSILKAQDTQKKGFLNRSYDMNERWELDSVNHKGLFLVTPYKPVYITAGRWSNNPNIKPTSENL